MTLLFERSFSIIANAHFLKKSGRCVVVEKQTRATVLLFFKIDI